MSMMDVMNSQQPAQQSATPTQGQPPAQPQASFARLSEGGDVGSQFEKVMTLTSQQLWQKGMAEMINTQLLQDDSDPAAVIGKFVSFLCGMTNMAFNSKEQAPEPVVVVGMAQQMADQMTDIALSNETVSPEDADDTSEGAALIGVSLFLQEMGNQIQQSDLAEYHQLLQELIQNAPGAAEVAEENMDDAQDIQVPDAAAQQEAQPQQQPPAMAGALGGQ